MSNRIFGYLVMALALLAPAFLSLLVLMAMIALTATLEKARAQEADQLSRTYLTPFPENEKYNVYVIGDSLGEGLANGLYKSLREDNRFQIFSKIHYSHAFARVRGKTWVTRLRPLLQNEKMHIAVIFSGISERVNIWTKGRKYKVGSEQWREVIAQNVDRMIKQLQEERVAVYWLGIPVMSASRVNEDMQALNDIFRERAFLNGAKFIDTWNAFADQFGRYTAFGPDITGSAKRLRAKDGIHFTGRGNQKLAQYVQNEIMKDVALAREERNIPLAGNQQEQRQIHRKAKRPLQAEAAVGNKSAATRGKKAGTGWVSIVRRKRTGAPDDDTTTAGEIKILRPRLTDAALANLANRARKTPGSAFSGEQIAKQLTGDVTALGSISPANVVSLQNIKDAIPLTQTPYYKVLIKGEQQAPKRGRADDFSWPKPDALSANPPKAKKIATAKTANFASPEVSRGRDQQPQSKCAACHQPDRATLAFI